MAEFVIGVFVGLAVAGAALILIPSRRVRQEPALDDEVETRILLGVRPEPEPATSSPSHPRDYDTSELQALRALDPEHRARKKR